MKRVLQTTSHTEPQGEQFERWWQSRGEWVEAPNQRRGGESGVKRVLGADGQLLYVKRQHQHLYRSLRHPFGRPTVLREGAALSAFRALGVRVPELQYCAAQREGVDQWRGVLVTVALEGFEDLDRWYAGGEHGEALQQQVLLQLGALLARLHRRRWQHGCLYSKHIFVRTQGEGATAGVELALLDLEKSRRRLTRRQAARHDFAQLRRHSSWSAEEWRTLLYGYRTAHGSAPTGSPL